MKTNTSKEIDDQLKTPMSVPEGLKTLSIFSMIGSGLLTLLYLGIGLFNILPYLSLFFVVFSIPFVLKFVGALKMYKGQKSGYKIYMIPSIILNFLLGMSIVFGYQENPLSAIIFTGLLIGFSISFYNYKDQLK